MRDFKPKYRLVVVGAGIQGLATAYALALRGVTDIAVFDKGYIGFGASGRNGALISSTFHTKAWILLYTQAVRIFENLSQELGINTLFTKRGGLELVSDEEDMERQKSALPLQNSLGLRTRLLTPEEISDMVPKMNTGLIIGGIFNPDSGVVRHDAVLWGYAKRAQALGVDVYPYSEVLGVEMRDEGGFVVSTGQGRVECEELLNAAGADAGAICSSLGVELPVWPRRAEALVTEAVKPFLDPFVTYGPMNTYGHQTARGELVAGTVLDFKASNDIRGSFEALSRVAKAWVQLFPALRCLNVLRQWVGHPCETPDHSPILGEVEGKPGLYLNVGWGGYGFMSGPAAGEHLAELITTGVTPTLLKPFRYSRFAERRPIVETSLVSHSIWRTAPISLESVSPRLSTEN